jgi:hypothetical protein
MMITRARGAGRRWLTHDITTQVSSAPQARMIIAREYIRATTNSEEMIPGTTMPAIYCGTRFSAKKAGSSYWFHRQ